MTDESSDTVKLSPAQYERLKQQAGRNTSHRVNESADKVTLKTKVKRGEGTRDEDRINVKVKGDDPEETAMKLKDTLDALDMCGISETLRETQPGTEDDD